MSRADTRTARGWRCRFSLLLLFGLLSVLPAAATELQPFTSDGCSRFPDGTLQSSDLWRSCCEAHDLAYWRGGTREERAAADAELQRCVAGTGQDGIAGIMLIGVRLGGSPWWPTSYRWGYGWPWLRGYQPLSSEELQQVAQQLHKQQPAADLSAGSALPLLSSEIDNWHQVSDQLYRSAQPSRDGFSEISRLGIRSVLNLRALHDDEDEAAGFDLELYRVPMYAFKVSEEKVIKALRIIRAAPKPMLVHCLHGSDRTGTLVALYRILFQGWSREAAIREMTSTGYGFHAMFGNLVEYLRHVDLDQLRKSVFLPTSTGE